jgi:hypothetical protein
MATTRVANVAFFRIDGNGNVISKDSITEPLSSHLAGSYEQRVIEDSSNPSTLGYPTVKEYIEREALADYVVDFIGPDTIITAGADTTSQFTMLVESNKETWTVSVSALTSPVLEWVYSDGTSEDRVVNGSQLNHTFVPHDPPNSISILFPVETPLISFNAVSSEAITIELPPLSSNLYNITLNNLYGLTSFNTYAAWTDLEFFQITNTGVTSLETHAEWTKLAAFYGYGSPLGAIVLRPEWVLMTSFRFNNCVWVGPCSVPDTWTALETFRIYLNTGLTSLTVPNTLVALKDLQYAQCALETSPTTHPEWVNLEVLSCGFNPLMGGVVTHPEWTKLTQFVAQSCGQTVNPIQSTWTAINVVQIYSNSLSATEIDAALIALDACGTSNGTLNYASNPGSDDGDRSGAAATAKANLIARGWAVLPA